MVIGRRCSWELEFAGSCRLCVDMTPDPTGRSTTVEWGANRDSGLGHHLWGVLHSCESASWWLFSWTRWTSRGILWALLGPFSVSEECLDCKILPLKGVQELYLLCGQKKGNLGCLKKFEVLFLSCALSVKLSKLHNNVKSTVYLDAPWRTIYFSCLAWWADLSFTVSQPGAWNLDAGYQAHSIHRSNWTSESGKNRSSSINKTCIYKSCIERWRHASRPPGHKMEVKRSKLPTNQTLTL